MSEHESQLAPEYECRLPRLTRTHGSTTTYGTAAHFIVGAIEGHVPRSAPSGTTAVIPHVDSLDCIPVIIYTGNGWKCWRLRSVQQINAAHCVLRAIYTLIF